MKELKQQFDEVCKAYLEAFIKRHNLSTADWIGQGVGEVVCVNDEVFLNFDDIRYDIDNADKLHINEIWNWTAYCQRLDFLECPKRINFQSWCKGAPKPYTDKMLDELEGLHNAVLESKRRFIAARESASF